MTDPPSPDLVAALAAAVPGGVATRATDRLSYAHDASHYLLTPRAVVTPRDAAEVAALLRLDAPLTFRSGGTSLSGQATTAGVLVDVRRHFTTVTVLDDGARVRCQPGATVRAVNARLAPYGRMLGPDPASEAACTIGGVVANNSSGMACGVAGTTYHTLDSMVLVLPSGTTVDTGRPDADERLRAAEPELVDGLVRLRDRVRSDPASVATLTRLFALKNTMGYALNAFLDHTRPVDVLAHLVVGSEGTLAFVAEVTYRTVPAHPYAATGLLLFGDLAAAVAAVPALARSGYAAIELLDAASLRVARSLGGLTGAGRAALLVEHRAATAAELAERVEAGAALLDRLPLVAPAGLSGDPAQRRRLWQVRKGLYAAVAGNRPPGTTALLEDVAVPVDRLLAAGTGLVDLLTAHGYAESVVFGHAKDGNLHFMLTESFDRPGGVERYRAFTEDMVELVLGAGGTLKAEHGTGRVMAPFVRRQYGDELYAVMREVKRLIDPAGRLNPGALLDDDPLAHLRHLKVAPEVEPEADRCVECGFCEPVCPSRELTLTPRRRIVLRREMARARRDGDTALLGELERDYGYDGLDTCAADGLCRTACPVLIDTGELVRRLRADRPGPVERAVWRTAARHWAGATRAAAAGLSGARAMPVPVATGLTRAARAILGAERVPGWSPDLPGGGRPRRARPAAAAHAVHFVSCLSTLFGPAGGGSGVAAAVARLADRAGVVLQVPDGIAAWCCGTPWKSKGLADGYAVMRQRVAPAVWAASEGGELPVVVDASSCAEGLGHLLAGAGLPGPVTVVDAVDFVAERVLPALPRPARLPSLAVHPTCAGRPDGLLRIAAAVADEVVVPDGWGCCGFAGDRGLLHPELTASATAAEAEAVRRGGFAAHASTNRTCELALTRATGHPYRHILEILAERLGARP